MKSPRDGHKVAPLHHLLTADVTSLQDPIQLSPDKRGRVHIPARLDDRDGRYEEVLRHLRTCGR